MTVLFMSPVPLEGAGCRTRIIQYLPYLAAAGIEGVVRPFMDRRFFAVAYQPGAWVRKTIYFLASYVRRFWECLVESRQYDVVYIYRECAPIGPPLFEWLLFRLGKPVVYDLDDAIHLPSQQEQFRSRLWTWLKWYQKVPWILRRCRHVVVGNSYLKAYAERLNTDVTLLPTPEDPRRFQDERALASNGRTIIGWIGTHSTAQYLVQLGEVFRAIARQHEIELRVVGAGRPIEIPGVRVINVPWSLAHEAETVQAFAIGVYPLGGSEFDRGKACYKAILYMAAGVPVVASNHGANREIIQDGVNGLLALSEPEWIAGLTRLIEDQALRERLRENGRITVASRYAVSVTAPTLARVLHRVAGTHVPSEARRR